MARTSVCKKSTDLAKRTVQFDFGKMLGALLVELKGLKGEIVTQLALHGLSQKIGDAYAGCGGDAKVARDEAKKVIDSLIAGIWTERKPGVPGIPSVFIEAVLALQTKTFPEKKLTADIVKTKLEAMPEEKRKALKARPDIQTLMADIRAKRAAEKAKGETAGAVEAL